MVLILFRYIFRLLPNNFIDGEVTATIQGLGSTYAVGIPLILAAERHFYDKIICILMTFYILIVFPDKFDRHG